MRFWYGAWKIRFRSKKSSQKVLLWLDSVLFEHGQRWTSEMRKYATFFLSDKRCKEIIWTRLNKAGYKQKLGVWVTHVLKQKKTYGKRWPIQDWRPGRLVMVFEIGRQSSNMSCFPSAKLLIPTCTVNILTTWSKQSSRSGQRPLGKELCSIRLTSGRTHW